MNGQGRQRELAVLRFYRSIGYVAFRLAWGVADVIALKAGERPKLVQVKSTAGGPYDHFRAPERGALLRAAEAADADALLAWWPPRGDLELIPPASWPPPRATEVPA